ncbi:MAG: LapA family protein [Proteobacteria bacterium]|nr:LapA family protein [Pseudomonadota bacterium]
MKLLKWIVVGLAAFVIVVFAVGNRQPVDISLFPFGVVATLPVFVLFFLSIILGVVISLFGSLWTKVKRIKHDRAYKKKIEALENELAAMRIERNLSGSTAVTVRNEYLKKAS